MNWLPIESAPKTGEFLLAVWEGDWNNPKQRYRVYHATGAGKHGPSWAARGHYRTEEGGAYEMAGWQPLPPQPTDDEPDGLGYDTTPTPDAPEPMEEV